jgi:hypothetical protein
MFVTFGMATAALIAMIAIVREVLAYLDEGDQRRFRAWLSSLGAITVDGALRRAWRTHARLFPKSRKRLVFGGLFLGTILSVVTYPLWPS